MITALRIERIYTKQRDPRASTSTRVPFLYNAVGIEMAARTYFDKPAAELDVLESATLVGMLKGTHYYNPVLNPSARASGATWCSAQMVAHGELDETRRSSALRDAAAAACSFDRQAEPAERGAALRGPRAQVAARMGRRSNDHDLYADGLVVHTTLDSRLQAARAASGRAAGRALQAVADVEWGTPRLRGGRTALERLCEAAREGRAVRALLDHSGAICSRTSCATTPEFRKAVDGGDAARRPRCTALHGRRRLHGAPEAATRRASKPASSRSTRPAAK